MDEIIVDLTAYQQSLRIPNVRFMEVFRAFPSRPERVKLGEFTEDDLVLKLDEKFVLQEKKIGRPRVLGGKRGN
jgi:hypothetical protein